MTVSESESCPSKSDSKRRQWVANVTKFIVSTPTSERSECQEEHGRDHTDQSLKSVSGRKCSSRREYSTRSTKETPSTPSTTTGSQRHEIVIVTCAPYITTTASDPTTRDPTRCKRKTKKKKNELCPSRRNGRETCSTVSSSRETTPCSTSSRRPDDMTQATSSCWSLSQTLSTKSIWAEDPQKMSQDVECSRRNSTWSEKKDREVSISSEEQTKYDTEEGMREGNIEPPLGLARPASPATDGDFATCFPQYDKCPRHAPLPPWLDPDYQESEPDAETEVHQEPPSDPNCTLSTTVNATPPPPPGPSPREFNPWHEKVDLQTPYPNLPTWEDDFPGGLPYDQCHMEFPTVESQFI